MRSIIITIDGYAGTGKGTTAKAVAQELGYIYLDTGAMYRALTYYFLSHGFDYNDQALVDKHLPKIDISFTYNPITKNDDILLLGKNVEKLVRTLEVGQHVSQVANLQPVRDFMVKKQQIIGQNGSIVIDARDGGTNIFPNADLKVFVDCDIKIRAKRRYNQFIAQGKDYTLDDIIKEFIHRDSIDRQHTDKLMELYGNDVKVLDTSYMTIEEQIYQVVERAREKITLPLNQIDENS